MEAEIIRLPLADCKVSAGSGSFLFDGYSDSTILANNAENCLSLAEDNLIPSPAYNNYYKFVIDYLYDGLEEADLVYGNGYNYAINK